MRKKLSLLGVLLLLLIVYYGCQQDDLMPEHEHEVVCPDFSVKDAKAWFEANAEVLRGLSFSENKELESRGGIHHFPLLTPLWEKGDARSNRYLRVIEIPLLSNRIALAYRKYVLPDGGAINESCVAQRKLVVMRRPNGYTRTFVMTLIPDVSYEGRLGDFINKFRYLGENDFSGYVMFSDPDGSFVEGYHYLKGRREYPLLVRPVSESQDVIQSGEPYTVMCMSEGEEGDGDGPGYDPKEDKNNMICDYCNGEGCEMCANPDCPSCHGTGCSNCKNVGLEEVVVTPDPDPFPDLFPYPDIPPLPNRCPLCGRITCDGSCRLGGTGSTGNHPKPEVCSKCKQPLAQCKCPKEKEDCSKIAIKNAFDAGGNWQKFLSVNLKELFLDLYRNANFEYGATLNYKGDKYSLYGPYDDNSTVNVKLQYNDFSVAVVHNHPSRNPPSLKDVFALINMNRTYKGKMESSFVVSAEEEIYVLHIEDKEKAYKFRDLSYEKMNVLKTRL